MESNNIREIEDSYITSSHRFTWNHKFDDVMDGESYLKNKEQKNTLKGKKEEHAHYNFYTSDYTQVIYLVSGRMESYCCHTLTQSTCKATSSPFHDGNHCARLSQKLFIANSSFLHGRSGKSGKYDA